MENIFFLCLEGEASQWYLPLYNYFCSFDELEWASLDIWAPQEIIKGGVEEEYEKKLKDKIACNLASRKEDSILHLHGCIQKARFIVSMKCSNKYNFIKKLYVQAKLMKDSLTKGKDIPIFEDLKLSMDRYILHSNFYASDMDGLYIFFGYPWLESLGTTNISVHERYQLMTMQKLNCK